MIAKLIVHGVNRQEAIERMVRAIDDYKISGIATTLGFCKFAIQHEAFVSGNFDTHFVAKYFTPEVLNTDYEDEAEVAAILASNLLANKNNKLTKEQVNQEKRSSWKLNRW